MIPSVLSKNRNVDNHFNESCYKSECWAHLIRKLIISFLWKCRVDRTCRGSCESVTMAMGVWVCQISFVLNINAYLTLVPRQQRHKEPINLCCYNNLKLLSHLRQSCIINSCMSVKAEVKPQSIQPDLHI